MWTLDTFWFDLFIISSFLLLGQILFGHFEERTPRTRKLLKTLVTLILFTLITVFLGRLTAYTLLGLLLIPVIYIHAILLPKKGINGWTAKPLGKYYDFRGWDKDIFKE
jgi:hypothetical protein